MICPKLQSKLKELAQPLQEVYQLRDKVLATGDRNLLNELKKKVEELPDELARKEKELAKFLTGFLSALTIEIKEWVKKHGGDIDGFLSFSGETLIWDGSIYLKDKKEIDFFPEAIEQINGSLHINGTSIREIPYLRKVRYLLDISHTPIKDLDQAFPRMYEVGILHISPHLSRQAEMWEGQGKIREFYIKILS